MQIKLVCLVSLLMITYSYLSAQEAPTTKPQGKIVGEVFGDFFYKFHGEDLWGTGEYQTTKKDINAFAIRRFNLGYDYIFNERFSARILLEGNDGSLTPNGSRGVYIKIAQLAWTNIFPGSTLIIGSQSSLSWPRFSERVWGYRNVEKTIMDFRGLGSSFDFGVSLEGNFNKNGTFGYSLMVGNGRAQRPENNKYKKIYGTINGRLLEKKLLTELYFDWEPDSLGAYTSTIKGFVGYQTVPLTIGLEPFRHTRMMANGDQMIRTGTSLYVKAPLAPNTIAFVRTDFYNPSAGSQSYKETFFLAGTEFKIQPTISFIPNIWINTYSPETADIPERKTDVVGRVTFAFKM